MYTPLYWVICALIFHCLGNYCFMALILNSEEGYQGAKPKIGWKLALIPIALPLAILSGLMDAFYYKDEDVY